MKRFNFSSTSFLIGGRRNCRSKLLTVFFLAAAANQLLGYKPLYGAEFFCSSGDVTCLIAAINEANATPGTHTINLEPGIYTLQTVDNVTDGANGLPSITGSIQIQAFADDIPTVIERDPAKGLRIFHVSVGGELSLEGVTVQKGVGGNIGGNAIFNRGVTSLRDSIVKDSVGELGAIYNIGTLNVFRSTIAHNSGHYEGGGIHNEPGGVALVENSTISHNGSLHGGGVFNRGSFVVENSAITFNQSESGGGIWNTGLLEIVNTTISNNEAGGIYGGSGGGGIANGGQVIITNSTIRDNQATAIKIGGGIDTGPFGTLRVQNSIIAGNMVMQDGSRLFW